MSEAARIVRFADAKHRPWRNGGRETAKVVVFPTVAVLDAFGWRVSLAGISCDGPFSTFCDVDRTFAVLDSGGVVLMVGSGLPIRLGADGEAIRFAGEAPCRCRLPDGPTTALNVMTRRGSFDCVVLRLDPGQGLPKTDQAVTLMVCAEGEIDTNVGSLGRLDVLIVPPGAAFDVAPRHASARAVAVSIWPVQRYRPER